VTPVKRMLPARLSIFKRAIYALATGWRPTAATAASAAAAAAAPVVDAAAAAASAAPLAFLDAPAADVIADIEARSRAPLGLPTLPQPTAPKTDKQQQGQGAPAPKAPAAKRQGLADKRAKKGLAPGQWDPSTLGAVDRRRKELLERKSYLRNFWYCVGECVGAGAAAVACNMHVVCL
jgi:hypothetical protein